MDADFHTRCLSLVTHLLLLAFLHAVLSAPSEPDNPLVCNRHSNEQVSFRYIIPKRFEGKPIKLIVMYKMKEESEWKVWKTYPQMVTAEIADIMEAPFQPNTLYQLRVISNLPSQNNSNIDDCEFCSQTDELDPVYNLTVHSVDSNWFAFTWREPPRICPKEVNYRIRYRISSSTIEMEFEGHSNILTLNTGEKYLMIGNDVLPNNTYNVSIELSVNEFQKTIKSPSVSTTLKTLPNPKPLTLKKAPHVILATESTLKLSVNSELQCKGLCIATWHYKELEESVFHLAGQRPISEEMEITGLNSSTVYEVTAFIQRHSQSEPHEIGNVPSVWASTLPVLEPINPEHPPEVIEASNTSLTMITGCQKSGSKRYIAQWEYKKESDKDSMWKLVGREFANREMTIKNLEPNTTYEVRFNLHWPTSNNFSRYSPTEEVITCPNSVPQVLYMWTGKRKPHSFQVEWSVNVTCKAQFLIRWKQYDSTDEIIEYPSDTYDDNKCPYNATLLNAANNYKCDDTYTHIYCFTVTENITPATRYFFEVTAVDWEGKCSEPETLETATPFTFWGGITVGLWVLIILGMLLLFAAVPVCILLKKRVAARMAAGRDVTFNASSNGTGLNGEDIGDVDAVVFHEPTTRILDRHLEPSYS